MERSELGNRSLRVAIVIPALNEAQTVAQVVTSVAAFGTPIVVDDGSSDNTGALAAQSGAQVIRHATNQGYDAALNSGCAHAASQGFDCIITLDADGQHHPELIVQFVEQLKAGADMVAGIRDRHQRLAEQLFSWVARAVWGIRDPLCGMKAYSMTLYLNCGYFDSYQSIGTELMLFAARHNYQIAQLPVPTSDRQDAPRFGRRWAANLKIFRALVLAFVKNTAADQKR